MNHDDASELLPWLVNDSLPSGEKEAVLAHAQACVACRRDLAELDALRVEIGRADTDAGTAPADMRRINERIDRYMARRRWLPSFVDAIAAWLPSRLQVAVAVQSIVIVALLGVLLYRDADQAAYTTLTDAPGLAPGDYLRIVVSPELDGDRFAALLGRHGLEIVEGPSERGVATVAFADGVDTGRQRQIAAELSAEAALRFVQPVTVQARP